MNDELLTEREIDENLRSEVLGYLSRLDSFAIISALRIAVTNAESLDRLVYALAGALSGYSLVQRLESNGFERHALLSDVVYSTDLPPELL